MVVVYSIVENPVLWAGSEFFGYAVNYCQEAADQVCFKVAVDSFAIGIGIESFKNDVDSDTEQTFEFQSNFGHFMRSFHAKIPTFRIRLKLPLGE